MPTKMIAPYVFIVTAKAKPKAKRPSFPRVGPSECGAGSVPVLTKEMLAAFKAHKAKGSR